MSPHLPFKFPYTVNPKYKHKAAYFCMEFGIDQALKNFSGGLGYLAGSHMRSGFELKQNLVGIGILWKYGYYDQTRKPDQTMDALFRERSYNFLQDMGIMFDVTISGHPVKVKAMYLAPEVFNTVPMFFLTTDIPENDWLSQTITHRLYDSNIQTKIAQYILLGQGGCKLLDILGLTPDTYHLNEAHGLSVAFNLLERYGNVEEVKRRMVFTTHTPVPAGNEIHDINLLHQMGFFGNLSLETVKEASKMEGASFNMTLAGLRMARKANGVSAIHGEVAREMWGEYEHVCPITHVTNAQNAKYWADEALNKAASAKKSDAFIARKMEMKQTLNAIVADQTGKVFDPKVFTLVWARRFADYKRADLISRDTARFERMLSNTKYPIQIIWSGKPYPMDYDAINRFNHLVSLSKKYRNVATLTGYELGLSKALKDGSDGWLNNPRIPREASGTSGMTAAMNGSVNISTHDGWIPEFADHGKNAFVVPPVDTNLPLHEQDVYDMDALMTMLEQDILPMYYDRHEDWLKIVKQGMKDVSPMFDSNRMADEYYTKMYQG